MSMKRGIEAASSEMSRPASIVVWSSENIRLSSLPQPGLRELPPEHVLQLLSDETTKGVRIMTYNTQCRVSGLGTSVCNARYHIGRPSRLNRLS